MTVSDPIALYIVVLFNRWEIYREMYKRIWVVNYIFSWSLITMECHWGAGLNWCKVTNFGAYMWPLPAGQVDGVSVHQELPDTQAARGTSPTLEYTLLWDSLIKCSRQKRESERSPGGIERAAQGTAGKRGRLEPREWGGLARWRQREGWQSGWEGVGILF